VFENISIASSKFINITLDNGLPQLNFTYAHEPNTRLNTQERHCKFFDSFHSY